MCVCAALYVSLVTKKRFAALALALSASAAGFVAAGTGAARSALSFLRSDRLHFNHLMQRIVICHIIVHELHDHGLSLPAALRAAPVEAARAAAGAIAAVRLQVGRARSTLGGCRRLWHRQPDRAMPVVAARREPEPKLGRGTRWRSPSVGSGVAACGRSARC